MFCTNCGKEIPDDSMFCEFCGCRVEGVEADAAQDTGNAVSDGAGHRDANADYSNGQVYIDGNTFLGENQKGNSGGNSGMKLGKGAGGTGSSGVNPVLITVLVLAVVLLIGGIYFVRSGKGKNDKTDTQEVNSEYQADGDNGSKAGDEDAAKTDNGNKADASKTEEGNTVDASKTEKGNTADASKTEEGNTADTSKTGEGKTADTVQNADADTVNAEAGTDQAGGSTNLSDGGTTLITAPASIATLSSFDWYFDEGFPTDGKVLTSLKEVCGEWNSMMKVTTTIDAGERTRLLITDAKISGSEDQLNIVMNLREQVEYMESTPNTKTTTTPENEVLLTYNGSWMEPMGYISVTSQNSDLAFQLKDFVEAGGKQYAIGVVYNGDVEAGDIVMVR